MLSLPLEKQHIIGPLVVTVIALLMAISEPTSSELFSYKYTAISHFEWWRVLSGHFLHTNTNHLLLNLMGVTLLWALHGQYYSASRYLMMFVVLCVSTSVCLYLWSPELKWYVGLSGVLHGLFVVGSYFDIKHKFKSGWVMLLGVGAKAVYEQLYGASADVAALIDANVAIDAHLFGTLSGGAVIVFLISRSIYKKGRISSYSRSRR